MDCCWFWRLQVCAQEASCAWLRWYPCILSGLVQVWGTAHKYTSGNYPCAPSPSLDSFSCPSMIPLSHTPLSFHAFPVFPPTTISASLIGQCLSSTIAYRPSFPAICDEISSGRLRMHVSYTLPERSAFPDEHGSAGGFENVDHDESSL